MERILISACLLGEAVRYDGRAKPVGDERLLRWLAEGRVVPLCPEVAGGLSIPRPPAEIIPGPIIRVQTERGIDVTEAFERGAEIAEDLVRRYRIQLALLKDGSPSCGSSRICDGSFTGRQEPGQGLTCIRLRSLGVRVFSENQLTELAECLAALETGFPN